MRRASSTFQKRSTGIVIMPHDKLFDVLFDMRFSPSKADLDIWMKKAPREDCYEYIAIFVDDLAIFAMDPGAICKIFTEKYNFKLKGVGPLEYHLGCLSALPTQEKLHRIHGYQGTYSWRLPNSTWAFCDDHTSIMIWWLENGIPVKWYSKRQVTVKIVTYGSEFVAARTAVDQITELCITLWDLGVPLREKSYMFGDNWSVVINSTAPHSIISKGHHHLSYHRVREAPHCRKVWCILLERWKDESSIHPPSTFGICCSVAHAQSLVTGEW